MKIAIKVEANDKTTIINTLKVILNDLEGYDDILNKTELKLKDTTTDRSYEIQWNNNKE